MNKGELIAEFATLSAVGFSKEIIRLLPLSEAFFTYSCTSLGTEFGYGI